MNRVQHLQAVPHLTTALTGPLHEIERKLLAKQTAIEKWLRCQWVTTPAPFYASVDLRNAGFKLAPVDTNLFPAGFNNLNPALLPLCIQAIHSAIEHIQPTASQVLIIAESHTRNQFYLESLATLQSILEMAGLTTRVASLRDDLKTSKALELPSGRSLLLEPPVRHGSRVGLADFDPDFILINNDLSAGPPTLLQGLEQVLVPPLDIGWTVRRKSDHFAQYKRVVEEFAQLLGIDPWLINPLFRKCGKINFQKREGEDCLARNVGELLTQIQEKYDAIGITEEPYVIVKADRGTYGMGIMTARSVDEIRNLNRKQRTKMARIKEGQAVTEAIVQEGVYTFETWGDTHAVAEPVVYMIDHHVVGGFYRVHTERGTNENLNAPGMHFEPLAFADSCAVPNRKKAPDANPNRFYAYGVIARLALLAAARELAVL